MRKTARACLLVAGIVALSAKARGDGPRDVPSVFFVSKSENRNQVHYGIRLDDRCAPMGRDPVYAYWRMLERDARATEPLLGRETPAYGIRDQTVTSRGERGGTVRLVLRALPGRPLLVTSFASGEGCGATASMVLAGTPAALTSIHAQLRWPFGVDYLLVTGRALSDGRSVVERIAP